jgi:hypothetical protein
MLAERNTADVSNAWARMPDLETQVQIPGSFAAALSVVRALLLSGPHAVAYRETPQDPDALAVGEPRQGVVGLRDDR